MATYFRKVIKIRADDSPNVRYAMEEMRQGRKPSNRILVPGVLSWQEYQQRRALWDRVMQCVGLDAEFYEGSDTLLYPPEWLNHANRLAAHLYSTNRHRKAEGIGIDCGEGGDKTAMAAVDRLGVIELIAKPTPNTDIIVPEVMAFVHKHQVPWECTIFDRGGGGKQAYDRIRAKGHMVRTVGFGEPVQLDRLTNPFARPGHGDKIEVTEERYVYKNRRAQMYGDLSILMDPGAPLEVGGMVVGGYDMARGFAIPAEYHELRAQLAPIPLLYDNEGRLYLPPKRNPPGMPSNPLKPTLVELIGHSPDEADAVVLAVHGMLHKTKRRMAGGIS